VQVTKAKEGMEV